MGYRYERTLAFSEEVSEYASRILGGYVEHVIFSDYLRHTGAPKKPGGSDFIVDFADTGVPDDYVKCLIDRHSNFIDKNKLREDRRTKDALQIPDISTYQGRYVPPRFLHKDLTEAPAEDVTRCEFYEIKPNSDSGEAAGLSKIANIVQSYKRYKLGKVYSLGKNYPPTTPVFLPLKWSEAFEYLRLVFMWENNLKTCDIDLRVDTHKTNSALLLYSIHIVLELDVELAKDKLRALAAGVAVAMAICAAAGILELAAAFAEVSIAESLLEAFMHLAEGQQLPEVPKVRVAPGVGGPDSQVPPEAPEEIPKIRVEPEADPDFMDDEELPRWQKALAEAVLNRGYALPKTKLDIFCDEDYYNSVVFDDTTVRRFVAMTQLAIPLSPTIFASAAYLRMAIPGFILAERLKQQIDKRFPNQMHLRSGERIPDALRRLPGNAQVTVVSQVLIQTAMMASFIDPSLAANNRKIAVKGGTGLSRGKIALPQGVLASWKGRDASVGGRPQAPSMDEIVKSLLGANPNARNQKFLKDALTVKQLKEALNKGPGFTVAIGVHALYSLPEGPVTEQNRFGELQAVNLSRMFAVTAKSGAARPAKMYMTANPGAVAAKSEGGAELYRYIGRMKVNL
jgi:hypothetical protein